MIRTAPTAPIDVYQDFVNALFNENIKEAIVHLAAFNDSSRVDSLVQVLERKPIPQVWLAAFQNEMLKQEMDSRHLSKLIPLLETMRMEYLESPELKKICNDITQIILTHREWCGMLSYCFFIPYTMGNHDLAQMIGNDSHFIRMLQPIHILKLIQNYSKGVNDVLKSIEIYLGMDYLNDLWAKDTIKYLLERSTIVRKAVFTDNLFATLRQTLGIVDDAPTEVESDTVAPLDITQRMSELALSEEDEEPIDSDNYDHFKSRYYTDQNVILSAFTGSLNFDHLDEDPEEAEDEEKSPAKPVRLRRSKSFNFKNE